MNSNLSPVWAFPPKGLRFLVIVLLVLGVFFRFVNIDRKVYWFDETFTSLRISGYTEKEAIAQLCNGQQIGIEDLQKYQHPNPEKTLTDTLKSLALEDPQHPPLYYVMTRFWVQLFGSSIVVIRTLTALFSALTLPCIYWLCLELFNSSLVASVAVALLAVSPFHVLYAQEAREYSLWSLTTLLSSVTLLRAMRLKTKLSWGMYAVTLALGLYTFLISGLVIIAHSVYVFAIERFRLTKRVISYVLASLVGFLAFTPWLVVILSQSDQINKTTGWTGEVKISWLALIINWIFKLSYLFVDFNYSTIGDFEGSSLKLLVQSSTVFILILVGYSIYFLCRKSPKQVWLFVLTLIGMTLLPLAIPDFISGGVRSQIPRYLIPSYLGIQLAVSYLLATQIFSSSLTTGFLKLWQLVMVTLISAGVICCAIISQAETWWYKDLNLYTPQVVRIINQTPQPLVITSCEGTWRLGDEMALSYRLDPKVRLLLVKESNVPQIPNTFSDVFFYNPFYNAPLKVLEYKLEKEQKFKIEKDVYPENLQLWKLTK
ncbi:glycosyltransferase family 39 protein [Scytonema hofmannii FACHB-248]|uniref:Glycosyltransferase family 39 protein n=1 Tax=Scytonema hofmannii FACHB-248 TaxID=1842502 RepID=A0ABR8GLC4_9CYAN|nr:MULTISPECIES: glycosyltransferase family 39 protein [Nostocales]MBD2603953.1 glycosyltransferase family 39 protein [Scytonema hofmannii FACHB-248]